MLAPELLAKIVCPACHGRLAETAGKELACRDCGRIYPVRDGIPVLLVSESRPQN